MGVPPDSVTFFRPMNDGVMCNDIVFLCELLFTSMILASLVICEALKRVIPDFSLQKIDTLDTIFLLQPTSTTILYNLSVELLHQVPSSKEKQRGSIYCTNIGIVSSAFVMLLILASLVPDSFLVLSSILHSARTFKILC